MVSDQATTDRTDPVLMEQRSSNRADPSMACTQIMEVAKQLYRRIGHKKTTVADIARQLSMSPANVYRFFPSKQAIEGAVVGALLDEVIVAALDSAQRDGPATERLKAVLRTIERFHAARFASDSRLYELVATAARENWPIVIAYANRLNSLVAQLISEGQAGGEFSGGNPMITAQCVLGATDAYLDPLRAPSGTNLSRPTLGQMIDFCIAAVTLRR
jgi:AcrR family transcriptional regulator